MKLAHLNKKFCVLILCLGISFIGYGQNRASLEKRKSELNAEIKFTNDLIKKAQQSQKANLKKLSLLKKQIDTRNEIVQTIKTEISLINNKHEATSKKTDSLENKLEQITNEYGELLNKTYLLNQSKNSWIYLLSSTDINTALQKWIYVRQFNSFRKSQYQDILSTKAELDIELIKLDSLKNEKESLLSEETIQLNGLNSDVSAKNNILGQLKKDEGKLRSKLKQQETDNRKLTASIERIIKEEMAKAAAKKKANEIADTPKALKLSSDFKSNKGRFSWPVDKGYISARFGKQSHPTIKNLSIQNNGIDIRTAKNATVSAIFEGSVVGVVNVPGSNAMVIVKHGKFYSVYANLDNVQVKRDQNVKFGQSLGQVHYNEDEEASELHFEIWEEKKKHDPSAWLLKK